MIKIGEETGQLSFMQKLSVFYKREVSQQYQPYKNNEPAVIFVVAAVLEPSSWLFTCRCLALYLICDELGKKDYKSSLNRKGPKEELSDELSVG